MSNATIAASARVTSRADKRAAKAARAQEATAPSAKAAAPAGAIRTASAVGSKDTDKPSSRFRYVLGPQEKALHDYLRCVFDPEHHAARVPNDQGGFELYTELWRTYESSAAVAGADGTAVIGLAASSWLESGNADGVPNPYCQILGYTGNAAATKVSVNAAASYGAAFPPAALAINVDWGGPILDTPTDAALNPATRIRLVAMELAVHSVQSSNSATGEIMLVGSVNPGGPARGGLLNGANWDDMVKTNPDVLTRAIRAIPNWGSDEEFAIVAIPGEAQAFEMCQVPAAPAALTAHPYFTLGMLARGMAVGSTLQYKVTYVWESELAKTNTANLDQQKPVGVPQQHLMAAAANSAKYAAANVPGVHALPWIETLASTNPNAVEALSQHSQIPPTLRPRPSQSKEMVVYRAPGSSTFLDSVATVGKSLLSGIATSKAVGKIPYIGGVVQGLAGVLNSIFN